MKLFHIKDGGETKKVVNVLPEQVDDSGKKEREAKGEKNREIKGGYCHDVTLTKSVIFES